MTKKSSGKARVKKLVLKKETIRDLDAKGKAAQAKGGRVMETWYGCKDSEGLCPLTVKPC